MTNINQYFQILDFIKLKEEDNYELKGEEEIIGTASYIAPEIWENNTYSKSSDVYAFGIAIYELICETFFLNKIPTECVEYNILIKKEQPKIGKRIPTAYKELIKRCTSFDENERPTFEEIVENLKTDSEFITEEVEEETYRKFIQNIDDQFK